MLRSSKTYPVDGGIGSLLVGKDGGFASTLMYEKMPRSRAVLRRLRRIDKATSERVARARSILDAEHGSILMWKE